MPKPTEPHAHAPAPESPGGTQGRRVGHFLDARAWLDADSRHAWVAHECVEERVATMLPWPKWHSTGLRVEPSFHCTACDLHTILDLGPPDEGQRCPETFEHDGRWCQRAVGHGGLHQADLVSWGEYDRG